MYSITELRGQSHLLDKHGEVEIVTEYYTRKKPAWWVLVKLMGVAAMVAVGYGIGLPTAMQYLPLWQAVAAVAGLMLVYIGIAFFFRPDPNTDNMGWLGGGMNDPTQYSDNINRLLWKLHCILGPGRFTSETLLDACVLIGLAKGEEVIENSADELADSVSSSNPASESFTATIPLQANRFEMPSSTQGSGQQLESWKYFQQQP